MRARSLAAIAVLSLSLCPAIPAGAQGAARTGLYKPPRGAGFSIEYAQGYKLVTVESPWPGATRRFRYLLRHRGSPAPAGIVADASFETPVAKVATFSTTYLPQIVALGEAASVVGVDSASAVNSPEIRSRIASGAAVEVSRNWAPNVELLIALAPDAVFAYGMGNEWDTHPKLLEAGLPVVLSGEWNESDPVARAEWIEFIAAFYEKEVQARSRVDRIAAEYAAVKARAAKASRRPSVLVNGPFQGTWTVSGGRSYMARLIADAGGAYLWADDDSSGGLTLSVEAVYARASGAEVWLNPDLRSRALGDLASLDPRFLGLPAVAAGEVWNSNLRVSPGGGSDYFESAVLNPQEVLADLAAIFHPELRASRAFAYYRRLSR